MMPDFFGWCKELGLQATLVLSVLAMCWLLLKKTFDNHIKEREALLMVFNNERGVWAGLIERHFTSLEKASEFQRQEHEKIMATGDKMINSLAIHEEKTNSIVNEFLAESRQRQKEHEKMILQCEKSVERDTELTLQMKEVTQALLRVNGEKY